MSIWEDKEALDKLQGQRDAKRESGRLTFDCFNLKYKEDRVYCSKGKRIGTARDGSLALVTILRGTTSDACRDCEDFTGDEEGNNV